MVTAYPAVLLRSAVSFSSRSVGCRSFWGFLEGICLCSESTCIVSEIMRRGRRSQRCLPILFFFWHPQQLFPRDRTADIPSRSPQQRRIISARRTQSSKSSHTTSEHPCDLRSEVSFCIDSVVKLFLTFLR